MLNKPISKIRKAKLKGSRLLCKIFLERLYLSILSKIFQFDSWHAKASISARPYRHIVAKIVNDLNPTTVVEVGCGLGEILSRINAPIIHGYDIDVRVIRAARILHPRRVAFHTGGLSSVNLQEIDVLLLINWIHELSPASLQLQLEPLLPRTKFLVLDALDPGVPGYNHKFEFLSSKSSLISSLWMEHEQRSFKLYKVLN